MEAGMYPNATSELICRITSAFPGIQSDDNGNLDPGRDASLEKKASYYLWMLTRIQSMGEDEALKASTWAGWVFALSDRELCVCTNDEVRDWVRLDKQQMRS